MPSRLEKTMNRKRNLRLLCQAFRIAGADKILIAFAFVYLASALLIWRIEPTVTHFSDGLWYCFAVATTVGFGDFTAATHLGRMVTVLLSAYSVGVIAILTAILTSYFLDLAKARASDSARVFLDDLQHLPDLSEAELQELSARVKSFIK